MSLQNDKTQLELARAKLQDTISEIEKASHAKDLRISELEYSAQLAVEKTAHATELKFRDLTHTHEESIKKLQKQYQTELESEIARRKEEINNSWTKERNLLKEEFAQKERELHQLIESERASSQAKIESMTALYNQKVSSTVQDRTHLEQDLKRIDSERTMYKTRCESLETEMKSAKVCAL